MTLLVTVDQPTPVDVVERLAQLDEHGLDAAPALLGRHVAVAPQALVEVGAVGVRLAGRGGRVGDFGGGHCETVAKSECNRGAARSHHRAGGERKGWDLDPRRGQATFTQHSRTGRAQGSAQERSWFKK